jgi:hypothetical protein
MDALTLGIGLLAIAACILPFILISRANKKHDQQLRDTLLKLANQHGLTVTEYDIWHHNIIGLDANRRTLLIHRATETTVQDQVIRLDNVKQCRKVEEHHSRQEDGQLVKIPTHLGLELSLKQSPPAVIYISFYEEAEGHFLNGEGPLLQKWHQRITQLLPSYKLAA